MPPSSMHTRRLVFCLGFGLMACLVSASGARAQEAPPPAYLSVVTGAATLERDGEIEPAVLNMPVVEGDILRTASGRIEVTFPDGSAIEIDPESEVEFISATRVRVVRGAMEHRVADLRETPSASADYLPQDLRMYGDTLDRSGSWQYEAQYGNVWYPSVTSDWQPYYNGSWSAVPSYGWTWIGADAWSWPTHHYGRWGHGRNAWFWIPGRTWSAAWVTWASATDYVSWCPLGVDGRPVSALSTGHNRGWNGWTVLSRSHFGARGAYTPHYSVDQRRIASNTPFIEQARAPVAMRVRGRGQSSVASRQSSVPSPASPVPSRQPSVGTPSVPSPQLAVPSRQAPIGMQSPASGRQTAVERRPIDRGVGRATPRETIEPRLGVSDPGVAGSDPRFPASDQRMSIPGARVPAAVYRSPSPDYRTPSPDYGRGVPMAVPRSEMARPAMPRSEVPIVIAPSRAQIVGVPDTAVRSPERARPATGYQAPPAAYRVPPAAPAAVAPSPAAPAAVSPPPANGASATPRAAPANAPQAAAPRSGSVAGVAGSAPAGARHPR